MMRKILLVLLAAAVSFPALAQKGTAIGYRTVAAAMADLKAKKGTSISIHGGWTIIEDKASDAVWSFVPAGHPAYPAVIRRTVVVRDGKAGIATESLCQNNKTACDKLMDEFEKKYERLDAAPARGQGLAVSEIQVQRLGEDAFRLVLTSHASKNAQAGQRELLPKAKELCGARNAHFGKYEFDLLQSFRDGGKDQGHLLLKQSLTCGEAVLPNAAPAEIPVVASAEQIGRVEQLTRLYFAARDQRRYLQAFQLMLPWQKEGQALDVWQSRVEAFNVKAGTVRERAIKKITWNQDLPQQAPGLYGRVDFVSQFANLEIHCGFVTWHEQKDGSFLLVREQENTLEKTAAANLTPDELAKVRTQFGCED